MPHDCLRNTRLAHVVWGVLDGPKRNDGAMVTHHGTMLERSKSSAHSDHPFRSIPQRI